MKSLEYYMQHLNFVDLCDLLFLVNAVNIFIKQSIRLFHETRVFFTSCTCITIWGEKIQNNTPLALLIFI